MKKNFKGGFDELLLGATFDEKKTLGVSQRATCPEPYTRTTVALKSALLEKIKVRCILDKKKLRDFFNEALEKYLADFDAP